MLHRGNRPQAVAVAMELLRRRDSPGLGTLYVAAELLHQPGAAPIVADVIVRCVDARTDGWTPRVSRVE
jgi:hypothetical protein